MRSVVSAAVLALATVVTGCKSVAPAPPPPPSPIAAIVAAKKVFVSNEGAGMFFQTTIPGGQNVCYDELFTSLQRSGHFELVEDPADADLVLGIKCSQQVGSELTGRVRQPYEQINYAPVIQLTILAPGAQHPVYTLTTLAGRGSNIPKGQIALAGSINDLTKQFFELAGAVPTLPAPETLVGTKGPIPPKVLSAKRLCIIANPAPSASNVNVSPEPYATAVASALKAANHYVIVDSPQDADLVLEVSYNFMTIVTVQDAATNAVLWTLQDPKQNQYHASGAKLVDAAATGVADAFMSLDQTH